MAALSPVLKKLQVKPGMRICVLKAPESYAKVLKGVPDDVEVSTAARGKFDLVHLFATTKKEAVDAADKLKRAVKDGGIVWISYPKGKVIETDLNRDILRLAMEPVGLDSVSQVAIDEVWSALRFKVIA